ncbi:MAG: succinylglutamate desuccinylase/aspartoacylase family protein [Myxococcota bacterium]
MTLAGLLGLLLMSEAGGSALPPPLALLGAEIPQGEERQLSLYVSESFAGYSLRTPVLVTTGAQPGPTLCLTAGIHGDELNGTEVVRRVFERVEAAELKGALVGVPIVNLHGFRRTSRYLPDRRDLNRFFPGNAAGSSASRIAHAVFERIVRHCDALVDLHTGSFHRTNLPQLRGDLTRPEVFELARGFASGTVVQSLGRPGTLRRAATEAGIPAITYEAGEPMRFQDDEVERGVLGIQRLVAALGMSEAPAPPEEHQRVYYRSRWVRVDEGGILISRVELGEEVSAGDVLGTVTDPISNERTIVFSPHDGRLIGMALNQVVIPGFAAFHVGLDQDAPSLLPGEEPEDPEGGGPGVLGDPVDELEAIDEIPE